MEVKNTHRKLKCLGGGVSIKVLDVNFEYLPPRVERLEKVQSDNLSEIVKLIKAKREAVEKVLVDYIFLNDLADEFRMDYSDMKRFVKSHQIPVVKLRNLKRKNQICCAVIKEDAKKIVKLKFGG